MFRKDAPKAVNASLNDPRKTETLPLRARLNLANVGGVSKLANPLVKLKGNVLPAAPRLVFASSSSYEILANASAFVANGTERLPEKSNLMPFSSR